MSGEQVGGDHGVYLVNGVMGLDEECAPDVWTLHQARCRCGWRGPERGEETEVPLVDLDCTCPEDGSVCFEDSCDLCSVLDGEDHCCKCPCEYCREDAFNA